MWFCLDTLEYLRARRPDRRRPGAARLGAEDQADPHLRNRDHPGRQGPDEEPRPRTGWSPTSSDLRDRGATDWIVQHAQSPEDAAWLVERGEEILGKSPLFCTEVGPVLGAHLGSGLLVGGIGTTPADAG